MVDTGPITTERIVTTKRKHSQATSRDGINFVQALVEHHNSTFQEIDLHNDLGNDAYVEFVVEENATGCCVALQIKSGSSYRAGPNKYAFQSNRDHFEYWSSHTLPVFAVIFDPDTQGAVWVDITEHLRQHPSVIHDGPYSIVADRDFSDSSFGDFREHCLRYRDQYSREGNFGTALESFWLCTHSMLNSIDPQSGTEEIVRGNIAVVSLNQSSPAQIVTQVAGGDAVEAAYPFLESAIVGIDVLHMIDPRHNTLTSSQIDRPVGDTHFFGNSRQRLFSVGAQNDIGRQKRLEHRPEVCLIGLLQDEVCGVAGTIPANQDSGLFFRQAALTGFAAPLAGSTTQTLSSALL